MTLRAGLRQSRSAGIAELRIPFVRPSAMRTDDFLAVAHHIGNTGFLHVFFGVGGGDFHHLFLDERNESDEESYE